MYRRLLVPVNFSPASLRALSYATQVQRSLGGQLWVVHCLNAASPPKPEQYIQRFWATPRPQDRFLTPSAEPATEIVALAEQCDVVILGASLAPSQLCQHLLAHLSVPIIVLTENTQLPSSRWQQFMSHSS